MNQSNNSPYPPPHPPYPPNPQDSAYHLQQGLVRPQDTMHPRPQRTANATFHPDTRIELPQQQPTPLNTNQNYSYGVPARTNAWQQVDAYYPQNSQQSTEPYGVPSQQHFQQNLWPQQNTNFASFPHGQLRQPQAWSPPPFPQAPNITYNVIGQFVVNQHIYNVSQPQWYQQSASQSFHNAAAPSTYQQSSPLSSHTPARTRSQGYLEGPPSFLGSFRRSSTLPPSQPPNEYHTQSLNTQKGNANARSKQRYPMRQKRQHFKVPPSAQPSANVIEMANKIHGHSCEKSVA